jgi:uncharacterized membrane protein
MPQFRSSASTPATAAAVAPASSAVVVDNHHHRKNNTTNTKKMDINPRWKGYYFMVLTSLINFSSVANVNTNVDKAISLSFGIVLFVFSLTVLILEWISAASSTNNNNTENKFQYAQAYDGKLEGSCLLVTTLYAIVGVAYMTRVGGIAYHALNVYFSAWLVLASHVYTLNAWSASRDILTIAELTGISSTLKSWYILAIASIVIAGTSIDMMITLSNRYNNNDNHNYKSTTTTTTSTDTELWKDDEASRAAALGIAFGVCSFLAATTWILIQYEIIQICQITQGGWTEFGTIVVIVAMWIVGTGILTRDGSIGATINGSSATESSSSQNAAVDHPMTLEPKTILPTLSPTTTTSSSSLTESSSLPEPLLQALFELQQAILLFSTQNDDSNNNNHTMEISSVVIPEENPDDNLTTSTTCLWMIQNETIFDCSTFVDLLLQTDIHLESSSSATASSSPRPSTSLVPSMIPTTSPHPSSSPSPSSDENFDDNDEPQDAPPPPPSVNIPGSNLYIAVWTCLLSSLNLVARWKAQQALQFAQAQQQRQQANFRAAAVEKGSEDDEEEDDEEVDDDLEDYEDAEDDF